MISPARFTKRNVVGSEGNYFIHDGYTVREHPEQFDDTPFTDEFQLEIYRYARQVANAEKFQKICDVGCGSGFKLVTNFFEFETLGLDVPQTVSFLVKRWPGRMWDVCDLTVLPDFKPDLVICSDVIEHVPEPNALLDYLTLLEAQRIIISTPERDQLCAGTDDGPPHNIHHVREWNFAELHAYIASRFTIREHFVINSTQCIECQSLRES